jgi:hypothetical protein
MSLKEPAAEIFTNLEYPACPLCGGDRREFPFRLSATVRIGRGEQQSYSVVRCTECGLHYSLSAADRERVKKDLSLY